MTQDKKKMGGTPGASQGKTPTSQNVNTPRASTGRTSTAGGRETKDPKEKPLGTVQQRSGTGLGDGSGKQGGASGGQMGKAHDQRREDEPDPKGARRSDATDEEVSKDPRGLRAEGDTSQNLAETGEGKAQRDKNNRKDDLE